MTLRVSAVSVVFATLSKTLVESQGKVEEEKVDEVVFEDGAADLVITVEELKKHNSESSLWVVYDGEVYDLTNFVMILSDP